MTDDRTEAIRRRLDEDLSLDAFERDDRSTEEAATGFFQDLFVQVLNFDATPSPLGDATWQDLPVHEWSKASRANAARLFAEAGNFRVIYVELEELTRTAERNAIRSLTRSDRSGGWAIDGSFLTVFDAPDEGVWHLVTPYEEETDDITAGRPVLRRYTLGEGETHRTVANGLADVDASKGRLAERIDEAFRVKPVTERFYADYKTVFRQFDREFRASGMELEDAKEYAHVTLNRLLFLYYLQKKGWVGDRRDFVAWFVEQYQNSEASGVFHETWLDSLFFEGMNRPAGEEVTGDLPEPVAQTVREMPHMNGGVFQETVWDDEGAYLGDETVIGAISDFLEKYNFTITEESPYDVDVAVDPAMLGKIYESMIAEEERDEAGIFYTPRTEVDLMCRLAIYEQFPDSGFDTDLGIDFVFAEPDDWRARHELAEEERNRLREWLGDITAVDPACGSGAFLVGLKRVLTELCRKLGMEVDYERKERILEENIYGVDVKEWAIRVAEFRLWLSLVESESELPERRSVPPNVRFNLRTGDSLVQTSDADGPFLWELDFAEVMLDGGFDVVVGNPPYVRRETLYPQDVDPERIDAMADGEVTSIKNQYVSDLRGYVEETYDVRPGKWSDLYIYFFFRGHDILKRGGSLVYVTANSWLSSDYGEKLQGGLLEHGDLQYVLSNERQRTFEDAEVNTVITSLRKRGNDGELQSATSFITVKRPYSKIVQSGTARNLLHGTKGETGSSVATTIDTEFRQEPVLVEEFPDLRRITVPHESLWSLGGGTVQKVEDGGSSERVYSEKHGIGGAQSSLAGYRDDESTSVAGEYDGEMNWSVFVRAPDVFFEEVQDALQLKLEEIADVHLGLNSGRNSFFYLTDDEIDEHGIEEQYLTPLLKSPKEIDRYSVAMDDLEYHVLDVQQDRSELAGTAVLEYIERGEAEGYHERPFFRSKDESNWYKKTMYDSPLVQPRDVNTRHFAALNDNDVCVDVRLVCIDPRVDDALIWGFLNSSIGIFIKELFGRVGLGGGALENYVGDIEPMPVFDPEAVSDSTVADIEAVLDRMRTRTVEDVSEEFGASTPRSFDLDGVLDDRRMLDELVMGEIVGLTESAQQRVYEATLELVDARIEKSEST